MPASRIIRPFLAIAVVLSTVIATSPSSSDWIVKRIETATDRTISLAGNVIIEKGGHLTLRRSSLTLNNASHGQYGIRVKSGGAITIEDHSLITTSNNDAHLFFTVEHGAVFLMRESELRHVGWGDGSNALNIAADDPVLENNVIAEAGSVSLIGAGKGGRIVGNRFEGGTVLGLDRRSGVTITDNSFPPGPWFAISLTLSHSNLINNNTFDHANHGPVALYGSWNNEFSHNQVIGGSGPYIMGESGNTVVTDNTFEGNEGVSVMHADNTTIMRNTFTHTTHWVVSLYYSSHNVIADNLATDNTGVKSLADVELRHASYNLIANNRISSASVGESGRIGILIWASSTNNTIRGNDIKVPRRGISIHYGSDANTVAYNTIHQTTECPVVVEASAQNLIHHNNFLGGGRPPYDDTGTNSWKQGQQGNYWADYEGDGSIPYPIPPSAADIRPLPAPVQVQNEPASPNSPLPIRFEDLEGIGVTGDLEIRDKTVGPYNEVTVYQGGHLTLRNATLLMVGRANGIAVESGGTLEVLNSRIVPPVADRGGYTFWVLEGGKLIIRNSEVRGVGKLEGCGDWSGIAILASGAVIEDSTLVDCGCISLIGEGNQFNRNIVRENRAAVAGFNLTSSSFCDNRISGCLDLGLGAEGRGNLIQGNTVSHVWGFGIATGRDATIADNEVSHSDTGLFVGADGASVLRNHVRDIFGWALINWGGGSHIGYNTFADSGGGVDSFGGSTYYCNNFIDNLVQFQGGAERMDYRGKGNYWSDYQAVDANHDGIGDTPYLIKDGGQDNFPFVSPVPRPSRRWIQRYFSGGTRP